MGLGTPGMKSPVCVHHREPLLLGPRVKGCAYSLGICLWFPSVRPWGRCCESLRGCGEQVNASLAHVPRWEGKSFSHQVLVSSATKLLSRSWVLALDRPLRALRPRDPSLEAEGPSMGAGVRSWRFWCSPEAFPPPHLLGQGDWLGCDSYPLGVRQACPDL